MRYLTGAYAGQAAVTGRSADDLRFCRRSRSASSPSRPGRRLLKRPADENPGQVLTVGTRAIEVIRRTRALRGVGRRLARAGTRGERLLDRRRPDRRGTHMHQRDIAALDGGADNGPVDPALSELLERPAR